MISALSIVAVVLTGCEKELGFDEGGENLNVIAISMVASPDTTLEAIVARTYRTGVVGIGKFHNAYGCPDSRDCKDSEISAGPFA